MSRESELLSRAVTVTNIEWLAQATRDAAPGDIILCEPPFPFERIGDWSGGMHPIEDEL